MSVCSKTPSTATDSGCTEQGAGDLHISDEEVPGWPETDRTRSEEEGRSEDALPETVFLQLLRDDVLALLPAGSGRNMVELHARIGRRPWETRHLRFACLDWDAISVERADGTHEQRTYPFLTYWMQKTRRRHVLPLHHSDAAVIERQQQHLRAAHPEWFTPDGAPQHPEMLLFPTIRRSRANQHGTRPYDTTTLGLWLDNWIQAIPELLDEDGTPFDRRRVFPYAFRHTYAQLRADAEVPLDVLQVLMGHRHPSATQAYYRTSHRRRVNAVHDIAARFLRHRRRPGPRADPPGVRRRPPASRCGVIEMMRRTRTPLSDAEITRRARVNRQYLQRHRDLKARAAKIRADLDGDAARAAVAARSEREAALTAENGMLVEQNAQLRRDLETARAALRTLRVQELATSAAGVLAGRLPESEATVEHLRGERDEALAAVRTAEADLAALRNLNQRLMVENSHLLQAAEHPPG